MMNLQECCVVIIGSTCKICGKNFKCVTDVAVHERWRHNLIMEVAKNNLLVNSHENVDWKCDSCDEHFETSSDLRSHRRQICKKLDRRKTRKLRLIIKIAGEIMTEIEINRKYLKMHSSNCFVDIGTQTDLSLENNRHQDECAANIDLSLTDCNVDNSRVHCVQPHKAANRYIVGKFACVKDDTLACNTDVSGRSLTEMLNTPNRDANFGAVDDLSEEYGSCWEIISSQKNTHDTFIDIVDVDDKENSRRTNERKRRSACLAAEDMLILKEKKNAYCLNEISLDDQRKSPARQMGKLNKATFTSKLNSSFSENNCDLVGWSNEVTGDRVIDEPTNSFPEPVEITIDSENDDEDETTTRCLSVSFTQPSEKEKSAKYDSTYDDEVQEVLQIVRGQAQSDINHESPNRMEREMLVLNAVNKMHMRTLQRKVFGLEKNDADSWRISIIPI